MPVLIGKLCVHRLHKNNGTYEQVLNTFYIPLYRNYYTHVACAARIVIAFIEHIRKCRRRGWDTGNCLLVSATFGNIGIFIRELIFNFCMQEKKNFKWKK